MSPDVQIVLSAYNGRPYLPAQIESIRRQNGVTWSLHIRDDGSTDPGSRAVLAAYADPPGVEVLYGDNLGTVRSFWALLRHADPKVRYIAFCDQDDWWYPDKLARAVAALDRHPPETPLAYATRVDIGDQNLAVRGRSPRWPHPPGLGNALVENIVSGCTLVVNQALRHRLLALTDTDLKDVRMHDAWCYLVAAAFGRVVFEAEPSLIYRQHPRNVVGARGHALSRFMAKVAHQTRGGSGDVLTRQAERFRSVYGAELSPRQRALLASFIDRPGRLGRLGTAFDGRIWRQFVVDDLALRFLVLTGRV